MSNEEILGRLSMVLDQNADLGPLCRLAVVEREARRLAYAIQYPEGSEEGMRRMKLWPQSAMANDDGFLVAVAKATRDSREAT